MMHHVIAIEVNIEQNIYIWPVFAFQAVSIGMIDLYF